MLMPLLQAAFGKADGGDFWKKRRIMRFRKIFGFVAMTLLALPSFSQEKVCQDEYERWKRVEGAYAELLGVMKGVTYVYSLELASPEVCLPDRAELRIKAIGDAMMRASVVEKPEEPFAVDYVFTRAEAHRFLKRFSPCGSRPLPQSHN